MDLEEEEVENTTLTVSIERGSAPIQGASSSSADVPFGSSAAVTRVWRTWYKLMSLFLRMLESNLPILVQIDRCVSMKSKAQSFDKLTDLVLTSNLEFGDQITSRQMQQSAAKRKTEGLDRHRSWCYSISLVGALHCSQKKREPSQL